MATKRCYYEVLEVARESDGETIKNSYRKLALRYHPDRAGGDPEAEVRFKEVSEAYAVLSDPHKRGRYDRYGHAGLNAQELPHFNGAADIFDLFGDLFGNVFGGGRARRGPRGGDDIQVQVEIDLLEAARGATRELRIPRRELCSTCGGSGAKPPTRPPPCRRCNGQGAVLHGQGFFRMQTTCPGCGGRGVVIPDPCPACHGGGVVEREHVLRIEIPPGVETNMVIRAAGEGQPGEAGAPPGELHVHLRVRKHPIFVREGHDLHCELPVSFSQAALGGEVEVPLLDGSRAALKLKRGNQYGDTERLRGKGMPVFRGGGRAGDLVVHLNVVTPTRLTRRQEELLRELAELDDTHPPPEQKSFWDRVKEFFSAKDEPAAAPPT